MAKAKDVLFIRLTWWFKRNRDQLKVVFTGHGDFYSVPINQIVDWANEYEVQNWELQFIAEVYGYYLLMLQVPVIQEIEKIFAESENINREPAVKKPFPDPILIGHIYSRIQTWIELLDKLCNNSNIEVDPEMAKLFREHSAAMSKA